jgi:hypothetical protein
MSESSARASVYVFSVSSALIALGFIGQLSEVGDAFNVFALAVLPTLYLLGSCPSSDWSNAGPRTSATAW